MPEPLLRVEDLRLNFETIEGGSKVLDGVSFEVYKKEVFALVGETGCGKTVTALSIMGLLPPNAKILSGKILFRGEDLLSKSAEEMRKIRGRRISMIFQEPSTSLNPVFTAGEQITRVIMTHQDVTRDVATTKATQLLSTVAMPEPATVLRSYPHELSGGMQQRVMISMALSSKPDLLIADEPTTAVDVTIQAQILDLLMDLKERLGLSMLLITHNLAVVAETSDRLAVMYAGNIVEVGKTPEIFRDPKHPYTRGLLRALPRADARGKELEYLRGSIPSLLDPPKGCRYHPRCEFAMPICSQIKPEVIETSTGHKVSCYLYEEKVANG